MAMLEKRLLLDGWSAYKWLNVVLVACCAVFVGVLVMVACAIPAFLHRVSPSLLLATLWVLAALIFLSTLGVGIPFIRVLYREARAGYTTMLRGYRQFEQRDPETGDLLREAGAEFPSKPGLKAAREFARLNSTSGR